MTADGRLLQVDADHHPDLFWAIRGGGGNFGVVTRFHYRLHELPGIVGGMLLLPATPDTVAGFIAAAEAAPDELSTIANVMPCPPMPFVPPEHHGELVIMALVAYAGDAEAGERAIAPLRALATPVADLLRPMTYPEIYPPEDPDYHPTAAARTLFIDRVDREVADAHRVPAAVVDRVVHARSQLRPLGGAMARVPADATAFAHRASRIMVNVAAFFEGPDDQVVQEAWVTDVAAELEQDDHGAYVNFIGDEGPERIRAAYPGPTLDRLAAIKARYDPTNLFHLNQNVAPAAAARTPAEAAAPDRRPPAAVTSGELDAGGSGVLGQRFERLVGRRGRVVEAHHPADARVAIAAEEIDPGRPADPEPLLPDVDRHGQAGRVAVDLLAPAGDDRQCLRDLGRRSCRRG